MTEKEERRLIKGAFKYYKLRSGEIAEKIADCANGVCASYKERGGKCSSMRLNGYDLRILELLSSEYYLWCKVVDDTIAYYTRRGDEEFLSLIELKWWKGHEEFKLKSELHIGKTTLYAWEDKILKKAREYAIFYHLIEP